MDTKSRITVTLDPAQVHQLRHIARETGVPVSRLVRYAVGRVLADRVILLSAVHTLSTQTEHAETAEAAR